MRLCLGGKRNGEWLFVEGAGPVHQAVRVAHDESKRTAATERNGTAETAGETGVGTLEERCAGIRKGKADVTGSPLPFEHFHPSKTTGKAVQRYGTDRWTICTQHEGKVDVADAVSDCVSVCLHGGPLLFERELALHRKRSPNPHSRDHPARSKGSNARPDGRRLQSRKVETEGKPKLRILLSLCRNGRK